MPRSSHGKYLREGVITCRPPKLNDIGTFLVQLSLNGKDFSEDVAEVNIYPDPVVTSFASPLLFDMRNEPEPVDIVLVRRDLDYLKLFSLYYFCSIAAN